MSLSGAGAGRSNGSGKESPIPGRRHRSREHRPHPGLSLWKEALCGVDFLLLQSSPVYYGFDVPHGDGSGVVVIPGFLESDPLARNLHSWLRRIGYRPYHSGIGVNAECPNLLIRERLSQTIKKAVAETRRKVHLIGHSLGGMLAHALAVQRPNEIASIITLGSPVRGIVAQPDVFNMAERVRLRILEQHGKRVPRTCFSAQCNCAFSKSLCCKTPASVCKTAIYTRSDGVVDWHYCLADNPKDNFEVPGTHVGLLFNQSAYKVIAHRLREAGTSKPTAPRHRARRHPLVAQSGTPTPPPSIAITVDLKELASVTD